MRIDFSEISERCFPNLRAAKRRCLQGCIWMEKTASCWGGLHQALPLEPHVHDTSCEIIYILRGTGKAMCDGSPETLAPRHMPLLPERAFPQPCQRWHGGTHILCCKCHNSKNVFMKKRVAFRTHKGACKGPQLCMRKLQHLKSALRRQEEMLPACFFGIAGKNRGRVFRRACGYGGKPSVFWACGATLEGERLEERARELAGRASGRARRAHFTETLHPGGDRRAILSDYKRLLACARAGVELSPAAETLLIPFMLWKKALSCS